MRLSNGCKKNNKSEYRGMRRIDSVMRKTDVQRKSGPAIPPARVTMRATTTKPTLAGLEVISPAFLF